MEELRLYISTPQAVVGPGMFHCGSVVIGHPFGRLTILGDQAEGSVRGINPLR